LLGQGDAVLDVADDDQRAQGRLQGVVAVLAGLVLDEVVRLEHLSDVVEVAADAGPQRGGAHGLPPPPGPRLPRPSARVRARRTSSCNSGCEPSPSSSRRTSVTTAKRRSTRGSRPLTTKPARAPQARPRRPSATMTAPGWPLCRPVAAVMAR